MDALGLHSATGRGEAMPVRLALLQDALLGHFAALIRTQPQTSAFGAAASRLMVQFSDKILEELLPEAARRANGSSPAGWARREFDEALARFGRALHQLIPDAQRHGVAQLLQLRMLEAELRLTEALHALPARGLP
jgi:hypothetical protein